MEYLGSVREAQYHTQIVLMMYEDRHLPESDPNRFRVSINFSPGTAACQRKVNERLNAMSGIYFYQLNYYNKYMSNYLYKNLISSVHVSHKGGSVTFCRGKKKNLENATLKKILKYQFWCSRC